MNTDFTRRNILDACYTSFALVTLSSTVLYIFTATICVNCELGKNVAKDKPSWCSLASLFFKRRVKYLNHIIFSILIKVVLQSARPTLRSETGKFSLCSPLHLLNLPVPPHKLERTAWNKQFSNILYSLLLIAEVKSFDNNSYLFLFTIFLDTSHISRNSDYHNHILTYYLKIYNLSTVFSKNSYLINTIFLKKYFDRIQHINFESPNV